MTPLAGMAIFYREKDGISLTRIKAVNADGTLVISTQPGTFTISDKADVGQCQWTPFWKTMFTDQSQMDEKFPLGLDAAFPAQAV